MKYFAALTDRNVLLGIAVAFAIVFGMATIALTTYLLMEIGPPSSKPDAWVTLIGNMIGAIVSGLLAVFAAFLAVEVERRHREVEEAKRRRRIASPAIEWMDRQLRNIHYITARLERWLGSPNVDAKPSYQLPGFAKDIENDELNPKVRNAIEDEFQDVVVTLQHYDDARRDLKSSVDDAIRLANSGLIMHKNKWPGAEHFQGVISSLEYLAFLLFRIAISMDAVSETNRAEALQGRLANLNMQIDADITAWETATSREAFIADPDRKA